MIKKWKSFNESIQDGLCTCKVAPMGADGLEGFVESDEYKYEFLHLNGKGYYRIYHEDDYYEVCGPRIFNKYFNIKVK